MGIMTIFGNITRDAENRTTQGEKPTNVTSFSVAENDRRTKETIFYDCSYWGQGGKNVSEYLKKGTSVLVTGKFGTREYNGKTYLTVNVYDLQLAGGRPQNNPNNYQAPAPSQNDLDDEIPF